MERRSLGLTARLDGDCIVTGPAMRATQRAADITLNPPSVSELMVVCVDRVLSGTLDLRIGVSVNEYVSSVNSVELTIKIYTTESENHAASQLLN